MTTLAGKANGRISRAEVEQSAVRRQHAASESRLASYLPELDGLRGLAIAMVFVFHLRECFPAFFRPLAGMGWIGVELFFVLSGFLITRILLATADSPGYYRNFYIRRSLRIFPIYYLYIGAITAFYLATGRGDRVELAPWYFIYLQTAPQLYFQFGQGLPFSGHTWTLAIEEQFYWFWPLVIARCRRHLALVLFGMIILAAAVRAVATQVSSNPYLMHGWLPVQIDNLAAGALLGLAASTGWRRHHFRQAGIWLSLAGLAAIWGLAALSGGISSYQSALDWPRYPCNTLFLTGTSILFAGWVALAVGAPAGLSGVLTFPPLVRLGKVSYGLYLYHVAIFAAVAKVQLSLGGPSVVWAAVKVAVVWTVAEISFRWLEHPLLQLKERWGGYRDRHR